MNEILDLSKPEDRLLALWLLKLGHTLEVTPNSTPENWGLIPTGAIPGWIESLSSSRCLDAYRKIRLAPPK